MNRKHIPTPGSYCRVLSVSENCIAPVCIGDLAYVRKKLDQRGLVVVTIGGWDFVWAARALLVLGRNEVWSGNKLVSL